MDHSTPPQHAGAGPAGSNSGFSNMLNQNSNSGGNVMRETELEAVLSLQYRLCSLQHEHLLQHVAVYPRVYEVSTWETRCQWTLPVHRRTPVISCHAYSQPSMGMLESSAIDS